MASFLKQIDTCAFRRILRNGCQCLLAVLAVVYCQAEARSDQRFFGIAAGEAADVSPRFQQLWEKVETRKFGQDAYPIVNYGPLAELGYDEFRKIVFDPDKKQWADSPTDWRLDYFHPGYIFRECVRLNEFKNADGAAEPVEFDTSLYEYHQGVIDPNHLKGDPIGYAGFRLWNHLEEGKPISEVIAFLGASYFRAVAADTVYGASTRGLAIDCGSPKGEEFPIFREFWLEKPTNNKTATVYAWLDSKSVNGLYQFKVTPGEWTKIEVRARLLARNDIEKLGVAPITSMWTWGDGQAPPEGQEFRPEVHDSDGLLAESVTGEWLFRPVRNPSATRLSAFYLPGVKGFGLLQRDRDVKNYKDQEANYHRRPTVWIRPKAAFPAGRIELLEIESPGEWIDNLASFWAPEEPIRCGDVVELAYSIDFGPGDPPEHVGGKVADSHIERQENGDVKFTLSFTGVKPDAKPELMIETELPLESRTEVVQQGDRYIATFTTASMPGANREIRACLKDGSDYLSETWSYQCQP
ncbi:glucan biosynthesis protein [Blastopirellula sp. JC732]|uniref:Glucan biosynthesis protein n=1 Tax=Blastopirellula sediminis TaxID=2894196 RepID=A0A9X1MSM6_9BACT|nr:glucan biosynthesis protein [Blastopirellula sediminis]MCC9605045.1 glucan biosynthesis protein [Blastopirellula sediminis]MCC9631655.1 glucan biosynthesis protein [Blastopirellula sediminis]